MRSVDHYVYEGTKVLINKFDCRDEEKLREIEALSTAGNLAYLQLHPIQGKFDFAHLKEIHRFIFQDLYDWAGQTRNIDIGKNNLFCRAQFIEEYAASVFSDFYTSCMESREDPAAFVKTLAKHYADMNALHPFREGNGRSQREFTRELCLTCGYVFDLTRTGQSEMLEASIESFNTGNYDKFIEIFSYTVIPVAEYDHLEENLDRILMIFAK
ncbi:MAG: Fic family protein [Lachnospiraceae bacterium]|nr:Fic family protein [Lachnospiraceae bacterium]